MFYADILSYYPIRFIEIDQVETFAYEIIKEYQEEYFEDNKHAKRIVKRFDRKLSYLPRTVTHWNKR